MAKTKVVLWKEHNTSSNETGHAQLKIPGRGRVRETLCRHENTNPLSFSLIELTVPMPTVLNLVSRYWQCLCFSDRSLMYMHTQWSPSTGHPPSIMWTNISQRVTCLIVVTGLFVQVAYSASVAFLHMSPWPLYKKINNEINK